MRGMSARVLLTESAVGVALFNIQSRVRNQVAEEGRDKLGELTSSI